jgi:hypothetical protein
MEKREKITFENFIKRAEGVTGTGEHEDMLFSSYITGPQGARFELLKEKHHQDWMIHKAKAFLKRNFDVVKIYILESD